MKRDRSNRHHKEGSAFDFCLTDYLTDAFSHKSALRSKPIVFRLCDDSRLPGRKLTTPDDSSRKSSCPDSSVPTLVQTLRRQVVPKLLRSTSTRLPRPVEVSVFPLLAYDKF